jgi:dTDP-4-amino-4,6-dideoxygalactose transaminase
MSKFNHPLMENNINTSDVNVVINFLKKNKKRVFTQSTQVTKFENSWSNWLGVKYSVFVNSGSSANLVAFMSLTSSKHKDKSINKGDEVITVAAGFPTTINPIIQFGAIPVFIDIDIPTFNINCDRIESAITNKTKAILAVNLYGQSAELTKLKSICTKYNLYLIEDNAQSQGAKCDNKLTGSFGDINATSFYPGKNIGAFGDGGAITTDNFELLNKIITLRNYGSKTKYFNDVIGYNSRLDELQAAILSIKLKYLDLENEHRVQIACKYNILLSNVGDLVLPKIAENCTSVYHIYSIRTKKRDDLQNYLNSQDISTMIHYPLPPHLQKAYTHLGYKKDDFPIAEEIANTSLSLPIGPHLSVIETEYICEKIKHFFNKQ